MRLFVYFFQPTFKPMEKTRDDAWLAPGLRRLRTVRPCTTAVAPDRARALLAHALVNKYADHLPLYRQSRIFGRDIDRPTLAGWLCKTTVLLTPLADAIGRHVLAGQAIFADDTPDAMLAHRPPEVGTGKTQTERLWAYGRDER